MKNEIFLWSIVLSASAPYIVGLFIGLRLAWNVGKIRSGGSMKYPHFYDRKGFFSLSNYVCYHAYYPITRVFAVTVVSLCVIYLLAFVNNVELSIGIYRWLALGTSLCIDVIAIVWLAEPEQD